MSRERRSPRHYVLHDDQGRILALAPAEPVRQPGGAQLDWRPLPGPGQHLAEVQLDGDLADLGLNEILASFHVERRGSDAVVLRRAAAAF